MNKSRLELKRTTQLWLPLMPKLKSGRWAQTRKCQLWQIKSVYIQMRSGSTNFPHFSLLQEWLLLFFFCLYVVLLVWNCSSLEESFFWSSEEKIKYFLLCQTQPTIVSSEETIHFFFFFFFFFFTLCWIVDLQWNSAYKNVDKILGLLIYKKICYLIFQYFFWKAPK